VFQNVGGSLLCATKIDFLICVDEQTSKKSYFTINRIERVDPQNDRQTVNCETVSQKLRVEESKNVIKKLERVNRENCDASWRIYLWNPSSRIWSLKLGVRMCDLILGERWSSTVCSLSRFSLIVNPHQASIYYYCYCYCLYSFVYVPTTYSVV
jgi:hypothetical protein